MFDKLYYSICWTPLSYAAPLNYVAYSRGIHCCILFSYTAPYWASIHPFSELYCTLWAPLHPVRSTASCALHCILRAPLHPL